MCQYQYVRKHLTSNPDLEASRELLDISCRLCRVPELDFRQSVDEWYRKWRGFLAEKSPGVDGKAHYTHPRPRAAYRSLKFYMPYLWTYSHYPEICIPNTKAAIESLNQRLISSQRRMKLLEEYIARHYECSSYLVKLSFASAYFFAISPRLYLLDSLILYYCIAAS